MSLTFPLREETPGRHPAGSGLSFSRGLAAALAAACLLGSCGARLERQAAEIRPFVEATLPGSVSQVAAVLRLFFNDGLVPLPRQNRFPASDKLNAFVLYPRDAPSGVGMVPLPDDVNLRANSRDDPAMDRYLALPAERRQDDLFLYHPLDVFWPSEYRVGGKAAPFTCHFILHLEPAGPGRTKLEVLEYEPLVYAGRKLAPDAHGVGFGRHDDLRRVPPTTRDRVELLETIQRAVAAAPGG
ncbi:MAG TPA: hypothetical protein VLX28_28530 [Thermoanaerobaculia bacterium]|nr:hypothetical protein [Thermoanaerobaculia bacterium]